MPDSTPADTLGISALQTAFQSIAQSVATSIVDALVQPLQQEIESRVNSIIAEATKDIHNKIAVAIGQIQPIQIPISLLAQPVIQSVSAVEQPCAKVVAEPTPAAPVPTQRVPVAPAPAPEADPEPEPEHPLVAVAEAQAPNSTQGPLKRDKERTPKEKRKNFTATIVGLLPGQAHMNKDIFKFAKLSFVAAEARNSSQLVALSKSHNPVVLMTDFIRHASVESVRSANGEKRRLKPTIRT